MADRWLSFVEATEIVRRVQNLRGVGSAEAALARWIESRELTWRAPGSPISPAQMHGWYGPQKAVLDIKKKGDFFEITIRERSAHSPGDITSVLIHKHDIEVSDNDLADLLYGRAIRTVSSEVDEALAAPSQPDAEIANIESPVVQPAQEAPAAPSEGIPFMITRAMKAQLRERGFADDQIVEMRPADAQRILTEPPQDVDGRAESTAGAKKQVNDVTYAESQRDARKELGRYRTRAEDVAWAKDNNFTRRSVREAKERWLETLDPNERREVQRSGPRN